MENKTEHVDVKITDDVDKQYTTCCSHSSVGFIKYSSAFVISLGILTFSFIMIGLHPKEDMTLFIINPPNIQHN